MYEFQSDDEVLETLNALVQRGLVKVVAIVDGSPTYEIAPDIGSGSAVNALPLLAS